MKLIVAGGAGYIGSITSSMLLKEGYEVLIIDSLIKGHKRAIPDGAQFINADISDSEIITKIIQENKIDAAIHFAAFIEVGESVKNPLLYFENNTFKAKQFLDILIKNGINKIVFSSTAATYGEPEKIPITEDQRTSPTNPYGHSKLCFERILESYSTAYGLEFISLRYFNACGAAFGLGEDHNPETHLIPLTLQVPLGKRNSISIFGSDYDTPDGTCLRDYIHVADLAEAHLLAIEYLNSGGKSNIFNLGNGVGFSVREVIKTCEKVVGSGIKIIESERRNGDPARLVASSEKIRKILNWNPQNVEIEKIIKDAWEWHSKNPKGYMDK